MGALTPAVIGVGADDSHSYLVGHVRQLPPVCGEAWCFRLNGGDYSRAAGATRVCQVGGLLVSVGGPEQRLLRKGPRSQAAGLWAVRRW